MFGAVGDAGSILHLVEHPADGAGTGELPTKPTAAHRHPTDGPLDSGETVGLGMAELDQVARTVNQAVEHVRAALNKTARLYVATD